jgi:hypothetical protein
LSPTGGARLSRTRVVVVAAIGGAAVFGIYLGYLAWTNDSFPVQEKPFADYATMQSYSFNGTEVVFQVKWLSSGYLPLYAQMTSSTSDTANTPVCGLGIQNATSGQAISLPFGVSRPSASLANVDLSLAVRSVATGSEFTVKYSVASVDARQGNLTPTGVVCR